MESANHQQVLRRTFDISSESHPLPQGHFLFPEVSVPVNFSCNRRSMAPDTECREVVLDYQRSRKSLKACSPFVKNTHGHSPSLNSQNIPCKNEKPHL